MSQELVQGLKVVPAGHTKFATHVFDDEQSVVPEGHAHAPHTLVYWPPIGELQLPPTDDVAAVQPPQGYDAVLQTQLVVEQFQFWFAAQGRRSFWQELSEARYSWPPKHVVPAPAVGHAHVPCVLL